MKHGESNMSLGECSKIRTGQTLKPALETYPKGELSVILPKDVSEQTLINVPLKVDENLVPALFNHLLTPGDILIANKGSKFNSFLYNGHPEKTIATSSFYVVTLDDTILPEYLIWYLNQEQAKFYFAAEAGGMTIPTLTKSILSNLPIPFVSLEEQTHLIEFIKASIAEQNLLKDLLGKKQEFAKSYVWERINKYGHGR